MQCSWCYVLSLIHHFHSRSRHLTGLSLVILLPIPPSTFHHANDYSIRAHSALAFAQHGAKGFILHYLGDKTTEEEVQSLKKEIESSEGKRCVTVPGDISDPATSAKVS